ARRVKPPRPLFAIFSAHDSLARVRSVPLVVSSTLHLAVLAVFSLTLGLTTGAATFPPNDHPNPAEPLRLVFLATPGPGGGGGGGGLLQKAPAPKALREGRSRLSSPLPAREPPKAIMPVVSPPEPKPTPPDTEKLPPIVAPVVAVPADARNRIGV